MTTVIPGLDEEHSYWLGRRVLLTGHTGFKGAWLALWLEQLGAQVTGLALPPEDDKSTFTALSPWPGLDHHVVDLRDAAAVLALVEATDPDVILHLGAQALVRRGYHDPVGTYAVNVMGTLNVLRASMAAPSLRAILVITSDKVYASSEGDRPYREADPLGGRDPYASSKACAELVVQAWRRSFAGTVGLATCRAGNVIGGGDRGQDRLLPDAWRALEAQQPLRVRHPDATRPWQFVLEPLWGYLAQARRLATDPSGVPEALNFGPATTAGASVAEVVEAVFSLWGGGQWEREVVGQPWEAPSLHLDSSLAERALGWRARMSLDLSLQWTVDWWRCQRDSGDLRQLALGQIKAYEDMVED